MDGGDGQRFEGTMREREKKIDAQCYCRLKARRITAVDDEKKGNDLRASQWTINYNNMPYRFLSYCKML